MARPKDPRARRQFLVNLRLIVGEDDDLIALLDRAGNRAGLVKAALRGADMGGSFSNTEDDAPTEDDLDALDGLLF